MTPCELGGYPVEGDVALDDLDGEAGEEMGRRHFRAGGGQAEGR